MKRTRNEKLDLLIEGQAKIMAALEKLEKPFKSSAAGFGFGDGSMPTPEPLPKVKSYQNLLDLYGSPEAFAIQIKQREEGWPESLPDSIVFGCWDDFDPVKEFKADYPGLFVR